MEHTEKLPKEFKDKWIAALRSGEYKQGSHYLEDAGRFCCLGVACRVAQAEIGERWEYIPEDEQKVPELLRGAYGTPATLSEMNDGLKVGGRICKPPESFSEIADWIEENL